MTFTIPSYNPPDFTDSRFKGHSSAAFAPAPADGVVPAGYHGTSNFPEYVKLENGEWNLLGESRMDCVVVRTGVLLGRNEDGREGIYVHTNGFLPAKDDAGKFQFRTRVTRETPFSRDYDYLYELLRYEKDHGFITWVMGPAVTFDRDSRDAMAELIGNGFCHAVAAGNALATHDMEAALFGTALGQDIYTKRNQPLGHYNHLDLINMVRECGSLERAVEKPGITSGIIKTCIECSVPVVLAGSIRDDGPLPGVIADVYEAQDRMRSLAKKSTTVIALATQLHGL